MKSIGDQVREFMELKAWNTTKLAAVVSSLAPNQRAVSRQNIDNLVKGDVGVPRYFRELAQVMGLTVDQLTSDASSSGVLDISNTASRLSERALGIAEAFDSATAGLTNFQRAKIDSAIIQLLETKIKQIHELDALRTRTPASTD